MIAVIGVGNPFRRDDGAGLAVAERVAARAPEGVEVHACEAEPTRLIETWTGAELAVVADAVSSGAEPGTVHRFDATEEVLPARIFGSASTHALGVGEAVELARALGRLPGRIVVYGIEGDEFRAGEGLTPPVARAVEEVGEAVLEEVAACTSGR